MSGRPIKRTLRGGANRCIQGGQPLHQHAIRPIKPVVRPSDDPDLDRGGGGQTAGLPVNRPTACREAARPEPRPSGGGGVLRTPGAPSIPRVACAVVTTVETTLIPRASLVTVVATATQRIWHQSTSSPWQKG